MNWIPLVVFSAILVGTITFGFLTAPYWIAKELDDKNSDLESRLRIKHDKKTVVTILATALYAGNQLLTKRITEEELNSWTAEVQKWQAETAGLIQTYFSHLALVSFSSVTVHSKNFVYRVNDTHNSALLFLQEKLRKLEELIKEYERS